MHSSEAGLAEASAVVAVTVSGALRAARLKGAVETGPSRVALASKVDA